MTKIAVIQMVSTANVEKNLQSAARLIKQAVQQQAQLIILPENFSYMGFNDADRLAVAEDYQSGQQQAFLRKQAKHHHIWILGGTLPLKSNDPQRIYSASLLINDKGGIAARYNKIHLFDVTLDDAKKNYNESASTVVGNEIVLAKTPFGNLGLSICYDIRFPELYRQLSQRGADFFAIPAAFTKVTGQAHWEILCRSRGIENLAYVFAAGQGGTHENGRETYGHSMIVDPWGCVLAEATEGEAVLVADIDLEKLKQMRRKFPALAHRVL